MLLLDGVTGSYKVEGDDRKPAVDAYEFKKLCYTIANHVGGKVVSVSDHPQGTNFYQAEFQLNGEQIYILLNGSYPFFAFASKVEYMNIEFINHQALSNEIQAFSKDYRVLKTSELDEQIQPHGRNHTLRNENTLNQNDLRDIFYWKPKTVGEVIYNYWD